MSMRSPSPRLVAVAVLAISMAACTKTLDTDGLESQLKSQFEEQTDSVLASVECPNDVKAEAGGTFECTAEDESGATFTLTITQVNDQGRVDWEVTDARE